MIFRGKIQYSSQVTSRVHALQGMRAREKLARAQGALEESRAKPKPLESWNYSQFTPGETSLKGPGTIMIQPIHKIQGTEHSDMQLQHILYWTWPYTERDCYERLVGSRDLWRSKYKQHCWVEYDSTGSVRQLTKCPTCSYCAHDLSRENSLNNTNINNNDCFIGLNILRVIQVKVSAWPHGAELEA